MSRKAKGNFRFTKSSFCWWWRMNTLMRTFSPEEARDNFSASLQGILRYWPNKQRPDSTTMQICSCATLHLPTVTLRYMWKHPMRVSTWPGPDLRNTMDSASHFCIHASSERQWIGWMVSLNFIACLAVLSIAIREIDFLVRTSWL